MRGEKVENMRLRNNNGQCRCTSIYMYLNDVFKVNCIMTLSHILLSMLFNNFHKTCQGWSLSLT